ncbi:Timeless N-terminal domain-containing protein [Plasmodiophora brassicae]
MSDQESDDAGERQSAMDAGLKAELLAQCQVLGVRQSDGSFVKRPETHRALKAILDWLRVDDNGHVVLQLGKWETVHNAILPLIMAYPGDTPLCTIVLQILVAMLAPVPADATAGGTRRHHQLLHKRAICKSSIFAIALYHIRDAVECGAESRTPSQHKRMLLVLTFVQHVLAVREEGMASMFDGLNDRCLLVLSRDHVLDLLLYLIETEPTDNATALGRNADFNHLTAVPLLLLDCVYQIFRAESPGQLLLAPDTTGASIVNLLSEENALLGRSGRSMPSRHSRFGGIVRVNAMGGRTRVLSGSQHAGSYAGATPESSVQPRPTAGNRIRTFLTDEVRQVLLFFAKRIHSNLFNDFLANVLSDRSVEKNLHEEILDDRMRICLCALLHVIAFFLEFNREFYLHGDASDGFSVASVSTVLSEENRALICDFFRRCSSTNDVALLRPSLLCYKEMLRTAHRLADVNGGDPGGSTWLLDSMNAIPHRLVLPDLLKRYSVNHNPLSFLAVLLETIHFQIKVLEKGTNRDAAPRKRRSRKSPDPERCDDEEDDSSDDSDDDVGYDRDAEATDFIERLAHPKAVDNVMLIFNGYRANSQQLNHFTLRILHAVSVRVPCAPMLFRVSYLSLFEEILNSDSLKRDKSFDELRTFSKHIARAFFSMLATNQSLIIEALFPISRKACEILNDTGEFGLQVRKSATATARWSTEDDDILRKQIESLAESASFYGDIAQMLSVPRSARAVSNRLRKLGFEPPVIPKESYNGEDDGKAASGHDLRDAPSDDDGDQDAIATIDGMASFLSKAIAKVPHDYIVWFRDQVVDCLEGRRLHNVAADYAMVPVAEVGRAALECKELQSLLRSLYIREPGKSSKFWVIPRTRTANDLQKIIDITQHVLDSPAQAAARKTKPTRRRRIREEVIDSHHDEPSPSPDNDRAEVPTVGPSETRPSDPVDDTAMDVGDDETLDKAGVVPTKLNRMARRRCIADSSDDDEPGNVDDNGADKQNPDDADRTVGDVPDGSSVEGRSAAADDECVDERMNLSATLENADDGSTLADAQTMELEGTMGSSTQVLDEDDARDAAEGVGLSEHGSVGSAPPTR